MRPRNLGCWLGGVSAFVWLSCSLIPTQPTQCSERRPCASGLRCDSNTSTCVPMGTPADGSTDGTDMNTGPACSRESQCTAGLACRSGRCLPCVEHSDCETAICEHTAPDTPSLGETICRTTNILYVDNGGTGTSCSSGDGNSSASPLCSLAEALPRAAMENKVIRLTPRAMPYAALGSVDLAGKNVAIYGQLSLGSSGSLQVGSGAKIQGSSTPAVSLSGAGSRLLLDGVDLQSTGGSALTCSGGASLRVLRSFLHDSADRGLVADGCALRIHRSTLAANRGGGLDLRQLTPGYHISNNLIYRNGDAGQPSNGVYIFGSSGTFAFNTLANNQAKLPAVGGIACSGVYGTIENNILYLNSPGGGSGQSTCSLDSSNVLSPGHRDGDPVFVDPQKDNFQLVPNAASNTSCCVDRATTSTGPALDYYGQPRIQGLHADIGAAELR